MLYFMSLMIDILLTVYFVANETGKHLIKEKNIVLVILKKLF